MSITTRFPHRHCSADDADDQEDEGDDDNGSAVDDDHGDGDGDGSHLSVGTIVVMGMSDSNCRFPVVYDGYSANGLERD